jgi:hypothetical protein
MTTTSVGPVGARLEGSARRTGALAGLGVLGASDLPRWKRALARGEASGFGCYFPYVLAHHRPGRSTVLVSEDAGSLCVFLRSDRGRDSQLDLFLNPIPMDVGVARRCLDRANEFNGNRTARILRIDGNHAELAAQVPGLRIRERRRQYLYAPRAYADLSGKKYRTLRTHLDKVRRLPGLEIVPYADRFAAACRALLQDWAERHRIAFGDSGGGGISARALAQLEVLSAPDLVGEVVLLGGRLVAYSLGGEIRPGVGCLLDSKSDRDVPGLGYLQRYNFLAAHPAFDLVNDGSDARRAGLRQLKDSFRPVAMHLEYRGTQVET